MGRVKNFDYIHYSKSSSIFIETNKHSIAENKYLVNISSVSLCDSLIRFGVIKAAPNQVAERFINKEEIDLRAGRENKNENGGLDITAGPEDQI